MSGLRRYSVQDAIGAPVSLGDDVAYISRCGSSISVQRRRIKLLHDDGTITLTPLEEGSRPGRVQPYNCVKVAS